MNNCASLEIALKLKAAGFPEPHKLMSKAIRVFVYNTTYNTWPYETGLPLKRSDEIFAPTISDILPLIDADVFYSNGYKCFCVDIRHTNGEFIKSPNIHDAAALAWLHQNERAVK